jgi:phosphatidylinositol alpha-1,6-mannosyltransferase
MRSKRRSPRLLVITPDFPPARGGIQVLVHRLVSNLQGFQIRVVALDSPGARTFDGASDSAVHRVKAPDRLGAGRNISLNAIAVEQALRFRPHVTLSAHIVVSPAAATIRQALRARTVQYFHAKEIGAKPRLAAFAARQADEVIAVSSYTDSLIRRTGATPASVRIIPPGVDLQAPGIDLQADPTSEGAQRPTFLTIARLEDRYKGHDVLIRALALVRANVPDAQWIVIGDGPLRPGLEGLAHSYGVASAAHFLGAVSDAERDSWLRRSHLLAMPSRLPAGGFAGEGFGIVYLEAAAYGKPVIAGNVAGALDAVVDGESGLLVDPTDHIAVAAGITKLLLDRPLARRLGQAGALRAQGFAWPIIAKRVEAVLHEQVRA